MNRLNCRLCVFAVMMTACLLLTHSFAWAVEIEETVSATQIQPSWDPDDPASWTADESPFYPEGRIDMTPEEMLVFVKQIEDELEFGSTSTSEPSSDGFGGTSSDDSGESSVDGSGGLSLQSVTLETTNKLITAGSKYYGLPFIMGGRYISQGGFDCTGFVIQCLDDAFGIKIDRAYTTADKLYDNYCTPVSAENAKPGDLVFWRGTYGWDPNWISHVGIYLGGNIAYAASGTADIICFQDINSVRHINGGTAPVVFGTLKALDSGDVTKDYFETVIDADGKETLRERALMYRLYNRNSGEHFFTTNIEERDFLALVGWKYEGFAWYAPSEGDPVYRLYNPVVGDHHYTLSQVEREFLVSKGWKYEGIGWYSDGEQPIYRLYNPNAITGTHHYTASKGENDALAAIGWVAEGIGWYAK